MLVENNCVIGKLVMFTFSIQCLLEIPSNKFYVIVAARMKFKILVLKQARTNEIKQHSQYCQNERVD